MENKTTTKQERERRHRANQRKAILQKQRLAQGLCGCGKKTSIRPLTGKPYSTCDSCRASAKRRYQGQPKPKEKVVRLDHRLRNTTGVLRRWDRDGMGREAWWWVASAFIKGKQMTRRWAVTAHGDAGARKLAQAQRDAWQASKGG